MIIECCVSHKGEVTHVASQRVGKKLIIAESDNRIDAMSALIHRVLELNLEKATTDLLVTGRTQFIMSSEKGSCNLHHLRYEDCILSPVAL